MVPHTRPWKAEGYGAAGIKIQSVIEVIAATVVAEIIAAAFFSPT